MNTPGTFSERSQINVTMAFVFHVTSSILITNIQQLGLALNTSNDGCSGQSSFVSARQAAHDDIPNITTHVPHRGPISSSQQGPSLAGCVLNYSPRSVVGLGWLRPLGLSLPLLSRLPNPPLPPPLLRWRAVRRKRARTGSLCVDSCLKIVCRCRREAFGKGSHGSSQTTFEYWLEMILYCAW